MLFNGTLNNVGTIRQTIQIIIVQMKNVILKDSCLLPKVV